MLAPFVGSLLGVLIVRLPEGEPVGLARSRCSTCQATLGPLDLVPLLSFAALRGRCRRCAASIGWFYPTIELAALGVALWAWAETEGFVLWASCALGWVLLTLAVIDLRHLWLPDVLTLPLVVAGLAVAFHLGGTDGLAHAVMAAAAGFAAFWLIAEAYRRLRGREGLGRGDAKLLAAAGAWVSWTGLPSVVLIAAAASLAGELARRAASPATDRRGDGTTAQAGEQPIPFGPGLCLGLWIVWLYGPLQFGPP